MPRKLTPDYEHMTLEEICSLSSYKYRKYRIWLESKQKKKEIQDDFEKYLNSSCQRFTGEEQNNRK